MELPSGGGQGFFEMLLNLMSYLLGNQKLFVDMSGFDPSPSQIEGIVKESWIGIKAMALSVDTKFRK